MATIKGWFTMNGMHIPIMEGQSKSEAASKYINSKHGKTVAKLSSRTNGKKSSIESEVDSISKKGEELADMFKDSKYNNYSDKGQAIANDFYTKMGYGGKPEVVSKEAYQKELANNKLGELCRGIQASDSQMTNYMKQYKEGELHTSGSADSAFGRGIYLTVGENAEAHASGYGNQIMKCTIKNNSKVITVEEIANKRKSILDNITQKRDKNIDKAFSENNKELYTKANDSYNKSMHILSDNGYLAATLGYDAIIDKRQGVLVVLNRKKMIFSD